MIRKQFDELKHSGKLPSPSGVGLKIMRMTQADDWELDELVSVISADPALTSRLVKLANSANSGTQEPIATVEEAALRIGARNVSDQALGFTLIAGNRSGRCEAFDYQRFWSQCLVRAIAAEFASRQLGLGVVAESFTCALLSTVGELGLASVHPVAYAEVLEKCRSDSTHELWGLESERFAINSLEVSMAMMEYWGLPDHFAAALDYKKRAVAEDKKTPLETLELVTILRVAGTIARFCVASEEEQVAQWPGMAEARKRLGLDQSQFRSFFDEIKERWDEWASDLKLPTTSGAGLTEIERRAEETPVAEEHEIKAGEEVDPDKFRPLRILAVDDEPISLRVLGSQLKSAGHEVVLARNGAEALELTLETNPHIVISDWMMPEMDGLDLCKALRRAQAGRSVYFLLLTGRDEEDRVVEAFESGIDDYIAKPFNPKILLARVRAGLRLVNLREQVDLEQEAQREKTAELGVMARQLRSAAFTDPLTNLPNRRYGIEQLQAEWEAWMTSGQPLSVVMVDIDFFKAINDEHGHDAGDAVLQQTAEIMRRVLRSADVVARIGGEEFLVICPETDVQGGFECAQRLRKAIEEHVFEAGSFVGHLTISAGVGTASEAVEDAYALVKLADEAVYRAKADGRNCVRVTHSSEASLPKSA